MYLEIEPTVEQFASKPIFGSEVCSLSMPRNAVLQIWSWRCCHSPSLCQWVCM